MSIAQQLSGLYFFMFSNGSYSDYRVGATYVCDHEVTDAEWEAHYKTYVEASAAKYAELVTAKYSEFSKRNKQYKAYHEWKREAGEPEDTFVALHNMVPIGVTEMWRDCE